MRLAGKSWMDKGLLANCIRDLQRIRTHAGGLRSRQDIRTHRLAIAILGQFARDNACDVEGLPMYVGAIGELRRLVGEVDEQDRMAI